MRPGPRLLFMLLFAGIAVYVGRGALLGEWAVNPGFLVAFALISAAVYALQGDYHPIHE